jgi:hypothetical protein
MKRFIAAVSFAVLATPAFAQPQSSGPTSAIGPSWIFEFNGTATNAAGATAQRQEDRSQVASSGVTRSDTEIGVETAPETDFASRHVEAQPGYFDPSR